MEEIKDQGQSFHDRLCFILKESRLIDFQLYASLSRKMSARISSVNKIRKHPRAMWSTRKYIEIDPLRRIESNFFFAMN